MCFFKFFLGVGTFKNKKQEFEKIAANFEIKN
jgi:hypothetical protein